MALDRIHLRKLLILFLLEGRRLDSRIRIDIREEKAKQAGDQSSGGDFYAPFWADAKAHVFEGVDLYARVKERIDANQRRGRLYPLLRDGFLIWWTERRRWTNEPFRPGNHLRGQHDFPDPAAVVKIDSIMSVRDGLNAERAVYPYFSPEPVLSEEAARLGLWLLTMALPDVPQDRFRILDVIRGSTFSLDRFPLLGDEEAEFVRRYRALLQRRDQLLADYD